MSDDEKKESNFLLDIIILYWLIFDLTKLKKKASFQEK
jgi:hypothetical protein